MTETRFEQIYQGFNAVARKVYAAVPIAEAWTTKAISIELLRTGSQVEFQAVQGCLGSLLERGLITEPKPRTYRRVPVRCKRATASRDLSTPINFKAITMTPATATPAAPVQSRRVLVAQPAAPVLELAADGAAAPTPLQRFTALAKRASDLGDALKALASDIELAALETDEAMERNASAAERLRQFQAFMKGMA